MQYLLLIEIFLLWFIVQIWMSSYFAAESLIKRLESNYNYKNYFLYWKIYWPWNENFCIDKFYNIVEDCDFSTFKKAYEYKFKRKTIENKQYKFIKWYFDNKNWIFYYLDDLAWIVQNKIR